MSTDQAQHHRPFWPTSFTDEDMEDDRLRGLEQRYKDDAAYTMADRDGRRWYIPTWRIEQKAQAMLFAMALDEMLDRLSV